MICWIIVQVCPIISLCMYVYYIFRWNSNKYNCIYFFSYAIWIMYCINHFECIFLLTTSLLNQLIMIDRIQKNKMY